MHCRQFVCQQFIRLEEVADERAGVRPAGRASAEIDVRKRSGNTFGNVGANANLFAVMCRRGGANNTVWILDEDGDSWQSGEITSAALTPVCLGVPPELTIAAGVITVAGRSYYRVDGQGDAADDLVTINGGSAGYYLVLQAENFLHSITVKDGTGNIELDGADKTLTAVNTKLVLLYNAVTSKWCQLSYSSN